MFGNNPKTFFSKILKRALNGEHLEIVDDEFGSPCSVSFVSNLISQFILEKKQFNNQIYHLTHDDYCSRYDCGKYFLEKMGFNNKISPIRDIPMDVARPKFGVMDNTKLRSFMGVSLKSWKNDIDDLVREITDVK